MALATTAQYEAITGQDLSDAQTTRVATLLGLASDAVLAGAHGQLIEQATSTVVLYQHEGYMHFPQRPVTAVASVTVDGVVLVPDVDYRWTPGGNGQQATLIRRRDGVDDYWRDTAEATVVCTHGWDPIPGQLVGAVVALVVVTLANGGAPTPTGKTVGPFGRTWDDPQPADFSLTGSTRSLLDELCRVAGPSSVAIGRDAL